jgi:RsiW-degrading membrane proteinase PrsW (M82 family)
VTDFTTYFFWAIAPALLLLAFYSWRISPTPQLKRYSAGVVIYFSAGVASGILALNLQIGFETLANSLFNWQRFTRNLFGATLRQFLEVAPIEEGCKLAAMMLVIYLLGKRNPRHSSHIFFYGIALCLGFTTQENYLYLSNGTASIFERVIGTPFHTLFSAPWIYSIALWTTFTYVNRINCRGLALLNPLTENICKLRYRQLILPAWFNSVICHASVNLLAIAPTYSPSLSFLSYGLFPLLLWMFWRLEQLFRLIQGKPPIILVSGHTAQHRYWQKGLILFALILGGNAIFGMFLLWQIVSPLIERNIFDQQILVFILSRTSLNIVFGLLAAAIYRYLLPK